MNETFKYILTAFGGAGTIFLSNYLLSKLKAKIDFSETQREVNNSLDKRIAILEERTK